MDGKVSITITTDKPITVRVTEDGGNTKEQEGLYRLLDEVKGGNGHVAKTYERRQAAKR
jgi:hypothetical protein